MPSAHLDVVAASPSARQPLLSRRLLWLVVAQSAFGFGWSLYLLQPKFLATQLGADPAQIGRITAMGGLAAVATVPLVAHGLDRWGRIRFFWAGSLLLSLLSLGYLNVDRIGPLLYLLHGCTGAAFVVTFNAAATLVSDAAPRGRLGQAIGVLGAANMAMNAIATVVAERVVTTVGWHGVFGLGAVAGLLAILLSLKVGEAEISQLSPTPSAGSETGKAPWALFGSTVLIGAAFSAMFIFLQPHLLQLGVQEVGPFFVGFTCAALAMRVGFGSLGDRFGHRRVSIAALAGYGLTTWATAHVLPGQLWAYGAAFGMAHGVLYPTLNALVLDHTPSQRRGKAMAWYNGAFNVGTALSGWAWGSLAHAHGYPAVFYMATVTTCVAMLLLVRRETRPTP